MPIVFSGKSMNMIKSCRFHTHSTWEIILNIEGDGNDVVQDTVYPFQPGSIICIPPNTPHSKFSQNKFNDIFVQSTDFFISKQQKVLCFLDSEEKQIEQLLQLIYKTFHKKENNYLNIVNSLYDTIQQILISKSTKPIKSPVIEKLTSSIVANFSDPEFKVSTVIDTLPYCKDYIRRVFKEEIGMTPVSYLNSLRLKQAERLLKQRLISGYSIGEISFMCGFYDAKYFSRLFRRYANKSPLEYASDNKLEFSINQ